MCDCDNYKFGFDCMHDWEKENPGTISFSCEFHGIYTAGKPKCNKCERLTC